MENGRRISTAAYVRAVQQAEAAWNHRMDDAVAKRLSNHMAGTLARPTQDTKPHPIFNGSVK